MIQAAEDDRHIWQWLETLLQWLGTDGMSSEDTDVRVDRRYRVKMVIWHRNMDEYLEMIDNQQIQDAGFSPAGSRPIKRLWYLRILPSDCAAPTGLPEALYDQQWLASVDTNYHKVTLAVSKEKFEWLVFHSREVN
jgi:hypothetical protein